MLTEIALYSTRVILISFIILGTIGNALNLFIFTRPALLKSSCTLYLIAASFDNILVIYTSLLTRVLAGGFSIDVTIISNFMCKLRYYPGYVFLAVSPYFFILACFDRYCSSSTSATRRSWSNPKVAKRCILGAIILACILYLHMAIFFEITYTATSRSCYTRPGVYDIFYRIFYLVVYCILPSFCMGVLCVLTLMNIRRQSRQIRPTLASKKENHRRLDHQMIRMIFAQILTQLLCILPFAIISILSLLINSSTAIFSFFNTITILPLFVSYATSFYIFTLSSRIYRQELFKLVWFWKRGEDGRKLILGTVIGNTTTRQHLKPTPKVEGE